MFIKVLKKKKSWYWKIISENGKTLAHSETYSSHQAAMNTAVKLKVHGIKEIFDTKKYI